MSARKRRQDDEDEDA